MNTFTIVAYDLETYRAFSDATADCTFAVARIEEQTTWRELRLIVQSMLKAEKVIDGDDIVGLMVTNGLDDTAFALARLIQEGEKGSLHPQLVADRIHQAQTTTKVEFNNDDILLLMQLIPLGSGGCHGQLRAKLHQASVDINKKR